jgi:tetratricopeptide (TPR) repeat protein
MTFEQRNFLSLRYQGRAEDSENYFRELIAAESGHLFANAYRGKFLAERGEHGAAVPLLTVALEGRLEADDMRIMLAQSKFRANGLEAAIDCLSVGLERQPINPHCHFAVAQMFYEGGHKAKARDELNLVVSVAPEFPGVTDLLSRLSSPNTEKQ